MKVAYIVNKLSHTSIPLELACRLSESINITIISLYDNDETLNKLLLPSSCEYYVCGGKGSFYKKFFKLKEYIVSTEYDVVHTHHTLSGAWARFIANRYTDSKIIHTIHAHHDSFSFWQNLIIGSTLGYSDAIVGNSKTTLEGLKIWQKILTKNVKKEVIYNGVDVDRIMEAQSVLINKHLNEYNVSDEDFTFCLVGRFVKVKNHHNVLKAFEMFLKDHPKNRSYKLLFIGDGPERRNIEEVIRSSELLKESVILTGLIERDIVYALLHRIDVFIMASFHEGFCNALMEAMVLGIPSIVSNISVFKELFTDIEMNGFDPNNIKDIYEGMLKEANNNSKSDFSINVLNALRRKYDITMCSKEYLELYNDVLSLPYDGGRL